MALIRRGTTWVEPTPGNCPNGHDLGPNRVTISWDGTQRIYRCSTCDHTWPREVRAQAEAPDFA